MVYLPADESICSGGYLEGVGTRRARPVSERRLGSVGSGRARVKTDGKGRDFCDAGGCVDAESGEGKEHGTEADM